MDLSKIFGWLLLFLGLAIIGAGLFSSYQIFTGRLTMPELFKPTEKVISQATALGETAGNEPMAQINQLLGEKLRLELESMVPASYFAKILNLISWSTFALILIVGGAQISGLGIKLIKE
ncbi:MAG: hypothetical protein COT34_02470 [Candidatus Nealsonbacteria bacterium CG08_land_8_20_14_0_20_43_11]|uniref:Uncharacterized protein n=1 Tax=Candidatus Nealsonbacteria bacterium CG08_land_8_20_14_0_20_43_11 TaxID=1974706 RepID=A0A2M6T024_9BACT|nr:MAG: hypothetical protein COT34_02470 [Candidatus Nealsonbacteria bacterium CG08_land_8_20_14_0_20_43_11]